MTNPAAAHDLPVMTLGTTDAWVQKFLMAAQLVRTAREQLGQLAWSQAEQAALEHDRLARIARAEPRVRPMTDAESRGWRDGANKQPEEQRVRDGSQELCVQVGPLGNGRWAVVASLAPDTDDARADTIRVELSCDTEQHARELGQELITSGPDRPRLERLRELAQQAAERHAAMARQVRESRPERLARTRAAILEAWDPPLAERVLDSKEFGALAHRLHQLEERGHPMSEVLNRLSQKELSGPRVRDPAHLAEWFCENMLMVIDGDVVDGQVIPDPAPRRGTEHTPTSRATGAAASAGPANLEQAWQRAFVEDTVWPALRGALPLEVCESLRKGRDYDKLLDELAGKCGAGWSLQALLTQLPSDRIAAANYPASFLFTLVTNRARETRPPRRETDKVAMEALIRRAFPDQLATKVTKCGAWPALATTLDEAQRSGMSTQQLSEMLSELPADTIIRVARKPAAYTNKLIKERINARGDETPQQAHGEVSSATREPIPAPRSDEPEVEQATAQLLEQAADAGELPRVVRAAEVVVTAQFGSTSMLGRKMTIPDAQARDLMNLLEAGGVVGPPRGNLARDVLIKPHQLPGLLRSLRDRTGQRLDPASAIDRIALDSTADPDLAAATAHRQASQDAEGLADVSERRAGYEHEAAETPTPQPAPGEHSSPGGALEDTGLARVDDNLAASAHATAAEELDAAAAAALRARVVLTPPHGPTTETPAAPSAPRTARPVRSRARTPDRGRSQRR